MSPLISVIMPVKNAALFLKECIDSLLNQSYSNWELIAINDHSEDNSLEILQQYAEKDSRIKCLENNGSGIIDALRLAFENSKGEFLSRMDADDIMPPNKLELLSNLLISKGKGFVATGKVKYFCEDGVSDGFLKYEQWLNEIIDNGNHWDEIYIECVVASPAWLIQREDLIYCEAFEPNAYPEDYDLVFRFYKYKLKITSTKEIVHLWRDHKERVSRNHEHYKANTFFVLKLRYFFEMERDKKRPLVIWGAGPKGKIMAKLLNEMEEDFNWVSNNPNKHGKNIYDQILKDFAAILKMNRPQVLITVAQRNAKREIVSFFQKHGLKAKEDYYFFS